MKKLLLGLAVLGTFAFAEKLYEVKTSGVVLKDRLEVHAIDDIDTKGSVVCYFTLPKRTLSFEDQTNSSIGCRQIGKITSGLYSKKNVMEESKSWFFKTLTMDRIYDKKEMS